MSALRELQRAFQGYVLNQGSELPSTVVSDSVADAATRLHIYAEGMQLRFLEVLNQDFRCLFTLLGDKEFASLARAYAQAHPSRHPSIRWYGRFLPAYLAETEPWRSNSLLAEMASFEWFKGELLDAANSTVVHINDIAALPPHDWAAMKPALIAAHRRLDLYWNVPTLWRSVTDAQPQPEAVRSELAQTWLLWRQDITLHWRSLEANEVWALDACASAMSFGEICDGLVERVGVQEAPMTAATFLKQWVTDGVLESI